MEFQNLFQQGLTTAPFLKTSPLRQQEDSLQNLHLNLLTSRFVQPEGVLFFGYNDFEKRDAGCFFTERHCQ